MAEFPVTIYSAEWNPAKNTGKVFIKVDDTLAPIPTNRVEEFIAVMLMLDKPGVVFETQTGELKLPYRSPGG